MDINYLAVYSTLLIVFAVMACLANEAKEQTANIRQSIYIHLFVVLLIGYPIYQVINWLHGLFQ